MEKLDYKKIYEVEHVANGMTYKAIREKYNIPRGTWDYYVRQKLNRSCDLRIYRANDTFFDVIDTEVKAYLLGFLYADGYLASDGRIGMRLTESDVEILEYLKKYLCPDAPIIYSNNQNINRKPQVSFRFKSRKIYNRLLELGFCVDKTTTSSDVFLNIPDLFKIHFIRGFTDGDGCLQMNKQEKNNYYKFSLSYSNGTKKTLSDIDEYLTQGKGRFQDLGTYHILRYDVKALAIELMLRIYDNPSIFLSRKYATAKKVKAFVAISS